jgi:retron-type reverse transcriptase
MLLKVVMEPYMEPLGDNFSFGFRPGRDAHLAVSALYSKIRWFSKRSSLRKRSAGFRTKQILLKDLAKNHKQKFYNTRYILDADIEGCFDNISHD